MTITKNLATFLCNSILQIWAILIDAERCELGNETETRNALAYHGRNALFLVSTHNLIKVEKTESFSADGKEITKTRMESEGSE